MKISPCGFDLSHKYSLVPRYSETLATNQNNINTTRGTRIISAFKPLIRLDRIKLIGDGIAISISIIKIRAKCPSLSEPNLTCPRFDNII